MKDHHFFELITSPSANIFIKSEQNKFFLNYYNNLKNKNNKSKIFYTDIHSYHNTDKSIEFSQNCYEKTIKELSLILNNIHNLNWPLRSWKILIGPWLIRFISVVNDRIEIVKEILKEQNVQYSFAFKKQSISLAAKDMKHFGRDVLNYEWNDEVFCRLYVFLKERKSSNLLKIRFNDAISKKDHKNVKLGTINKIINFFGRRINEFNDFFIHNSYIGNTRARVKLSLALGEIPISFKEKLTRSSLEHDQVLRSKLKSLVTANDTDEKKFIIQNLLIECFPTIYLESFNNVMNDLSQSSLPSKKKTIFTCNCWADSIFKFWLAKQASIGSKILYGQHGGGYGVIKSLTQEKHELEICDKYYSWGWQHDKKKITPGMIAQILPKKIDKKFSKKKILIVTGTLDYFQWTNDFLYSIEKESKKNKNSFFWSVNFLSDLISNISLEKKYEKIFIKLHPLQEKRGSPYSLKNEIKETMPNLKILNEKSKSILELINDYNLIIFTYPFATPFYQCLAINKPSIVFVPENRNYVREKARNEWEDMFKANIFYDDPMKAAKFINNNLNNIDQWWNDNSSLMEGFKKKYANYNNKDQTSSLINFLKKNKTK